MKPSKRFNLSQMFRWIALVAGAWILGGCASTTLQSTWRDPAYAGGPFKRVFVVGLSARDGTARRVLEDVIVAKLKAGGVDAIPGWQYLSDGPMPEDALQEMVRTGALVRADQVRESESVDWRPASEVPGLFDADASKRLFSNWEGEAPAEPSSRETLEESGSVGASPSRLGATAGLSSTAWGCETGSFPSIWANVNLNTLSGSRHVSSSISHSAPE